MYTKLCPICNKTQTYSRKDVLIKAIEKNSLCNSCKQKGEKNPFFNKHHSESHKKYMSELNKKRDKEFYKKIYDKRVYKPLTQEQKNKISQSLKGKYVGNLNPNYGNKLPEETKEKIRQCTLKQHYNYQKSEEFRKHYESYSEYKKYYKKVWSVTNKNNLKQLENYEKRGSKRKNIDAFHLDHIFPISMGFKYNIPAEKIGHINNLRFVHWNENTRKNCKITIIPEHIKDDYDKGKKSY